MNLTISESRERLKMATGQELENQTINLTVWEEWQKERKLDLEDLSKNTDHLFLVVVSILIFFMQVFVTLCLHRSFRNLTTFIKAGGKCKNSAHPSIHSNIPIFYFKTEFSVFYKVLCAL